MGQAVQTSAQQALFTLTENGRCESKNLPAEVWSAMVFCWSQRKKISFFGNRLSFAEGFTASATARPLCDLGNERGGSLEETARAMGCEIDTWVAASKLF